MRKSKSGGFKMKQSSFKQTATDIAVESLGPGVKDGELVDVTKTTTTTEGSKKLPTYKEAYKNVDKDKYPTLQSFITAAEKYKKENPEKFTEGKVEEEYAFEGKPVPGTPGTPADEIYTPKPWEARQQKRTRSVGIREEKKRARQALRAYKKMENAGIELTPEDEARKKYYERAKVGGGRMLESFTKTDDEGNVTLSDAQTMSVGIGTKKGGTYGSASEAEPLGGKIDIGSDPTPGADKTMATEEQKKTLPQYDATGKPIAKMKRGALKARIKNIQSSLAKNYKKGYYGK